MTFKNLEQKEATMEFYKESELILNSDGSVYHLKLRPENIADTFIIVGDPGRVKEVSRYFDRVDFTVTNREFVTHTGWIGNKRISCLSHGIGTDNIDIVLNELDALVNIDLETRTEKDEKKKLDIIRIGTTGSLQADLDVDSWVASEWVLGLDGLLNFYEFEKSEEQQALEAAFLSDMEYPSILARPYAVKGTDELISKFSEQCRRGITLTSPGFYAPQGRKLRFDIKYPDLVDKYSDFRFNNIPVTNFEMETSGLYGLGTLLGHNVCTVCAVVANRITHKYSSKAHQSVDGLIKFVLEKIQ